jgi:hypothetical protein
MATAVAPGSGSPGAAAAVGPSPAQGEAGLPALGDSWRVAEADGRKVLVAHVEGNPRSPMEWLDYVLWVNWLGKGLGAVGGSGAARGGGAGAATAEAAR